MRLGAVILFALTFAACGDDPAASPEPSPPPSPAPQWAGLRPETLAPEGWQLVSSLVLSDWSQVDGLEPMAGATAAMLRQALEPRGVVALCELRWSRTVGPADQLSLRVLEFSDEAKATSWRQLKYGGLQGAAMIPVVDAALETCELVDGDERARVAFAGAVIATSRQRRDGGERAAVLDAACLQLGLSR